MSCTISQVLGDPFAFVPPEGKLEWGDVVLHEVSDDQAPQKAFGKARRLSWDDFPLDTRVSMPVQRDMFNGERFLFERPRPARVDAKQDDLSAVMLVFAVRIDWR